MFFGVVLFDYFYIEMLCSSSGSHQCQNKSNNAEQNMQNFTISVLFCYFYACQTILRTLSNNVQNSACAESQNSDILNYEALSTSASLPKANSAETTDKLHKDDIFKLLLQSSIHQTSASHNASLQSTTSLMHSSDLRL